MSMVATHIRQDNEFETCELCGAFYNATVADLFRLNKLGEVKIERINLYFPCLKSNNTRL